MACGGNSCYFGFGLSLLILGFVIDVIGVASPYWILGEASGKKAYMGLWQMCSSVTGCIDFAEVPGTITKTISEDCLLQISIKVKKKMGFLSFNSFQDWIKTVRGFGILGIILLLIAVLGAFFRICLKERAWVLVLAIVLSFMAGNYKI